MTSSFDPQTFNPHDPAFLADPYPTYALFRQHAPVAKVMPYNSHWVFRYADVKRICDGKELFLKNRKDAPPSPPPFDVMQYMPEGVFSMDPPRHDVVRPILDGLFSQAIVDTDTLAAGVAKSLLANAHASGRIELYSAYAMPLPQQVLMTVLGIPSQDRLGVGQWVGGVLAGHDITAPVGLQAMAGTCAMALGGYLQALMRGCPMHSAGNSMLNLMIEKAIPDGMSREEVQQSSLNFAVAGYLSTVFLIATGTLNLLRHPAQLALLRQQPELVHSAIEEMLRYDAPFQIVDRYAAEDTEIAGVPIKAGEAVTAVLASANRDPDGFADPDVFDITRDEHRHLGFGEGIHTCIGAPLVRRVAPVAFGTLLAELPTMRLDGIPQWQTDPYIRSIVNLPLAID